MAEEADMQGIVVGLDEAPAGRAALDWALREAAARSTALTAVRVWNAVGLDPLTVSDQLEEQLEQNQAAAQRQADHQLKLALDAVSGCDQVHAVASVRRGEPAHVLAAASRTADLVVVGREGKRRLRQVAVGSVSAALLRHAVGAVAVVPHRDGQAGPPRRVVVGIDHSQESLVALELAVLEAESHGAVLVPTLVHGPMADANLRSGTHPLDLSSLEDNERRALLDLAAQAGADGLSVHPEVLAGHPADELCALATADDLLVVGHRGRGKITGLRLGGVSSHVAMHAPCPTVVSRSRP